MNNLESQILQVPIEDIIPNRFQPRLAFDDEALNDLAASIKQHGIIQPLVLRRQGEKYEIIAGERRYKAAKMAGLLSVPAIISNLNDNESAEVAIVENVQRKDLTAIEEAKSYQALLDKGYITQEELAKKMGLSQSAISNKLRLLNLDEEVQDAVLKEKISERHARSLLKIEDKDLQRLLLNKIIIERLTVRQLEEEIRKMIGSNNDEAPVLNTAPNIANIVNNSVDIKPTNIQNPWAIPSAMPTLEETTTPSSVAQAENSNPFAPNQANSKPNGFFNLLEKEAANMQMEELVTPVVAPEPVAPKEINPVTQINQTENIEMLDDFFLPKKETEATPSNEYLNDIIKTIRDLKLDNDRVTVEEMNLPGEYQINIKIKKDN